MVAVGILVSVYFIIVFVMLYKQAQFLKKPAGILREAIISNYLYKETSDRILKGMEMLSKDIESLDNRLNKIIKEKF